MLRFALVLVFTLSALVPIGASRADAGEVAEATCCACEGDPGPVLYCVRVTPGQEMSAGQSCQAQGGSLDLFEERVRRALLVRPASIARNGRPRRWEAPSWAALVALLGAAGIVGLRRRTRRSWTARQV